MIIANQINEKKGKEFKNILKEFYPKDANTMPKLMNLKINLVV